MRTDKKLPLNVKDQAAWEAQASLDAADDPISQSFSGEERNRWYHNQTNSKGRDLIEQSTLSGLDSISDGRSFAIGDFNRDGQPDIAISNANAPLLQIFENQIDAGNNFIAIQFEGAAGPQTKAGVNSSRDGYGAVVQVSLDNDQTIIREFRCGEGFAAQNSDTMIVGLGNSSSIKDIEITWPSGLSQKSGGVPHGSLLRFKENENEPSVTPYLKRD